MIALFTILLMLIAAPKSNDTSGKEDVTVDCHLDKQELSIGRSGVLVISFEAKKGIHITTDPEMELYLDTLDAVFRLAKLEYRKNPKDYIDLGKPVRQHFKIAKNAAIGRSVLRGTLVYYFCSDDEGWCTRKTYSFDLPLTITNRASTVKSK